MVFAPRPPGPLDGGVPRETGAELADVAGAPFAELPVDAITPNPRQPRQVFDEEAMAELVHSIREIGLLQPVVVRRSVRRRPLRAGHGRAALAGRAGGRAGHDPGDRPRDRRRRAAARRPAGEPAPHPAQPAGGGRGLRPAARGLRLHATRSWRRGSAGPGRTSPTRCGCSGCRRPVQRRVAAGVLSAGHARALLGLPTPTARSGWPPASSPRACRCGPSRRSSRSARTAGGPPGPRGVRGRRPRVSTELAARLSERLDTRVQHRPGTDARAGSRSSSPPSTTCSASSA